jgi:octaprenyl-diphosphate synthase
MFAGWEEFNLIEHGLARLIEDIPSSDLGKAIKSVLSSPGKRVRPLILVTSSQAFGCDPRSSLEAALAIELVHAASLVHDDILDMGTQRRGEPSILQRFGPEAALLCGDYLISRSIDLISGYGQPVVRTFARACMKMSDGEMLDLSRAISPEEYYSCISAKTASLFAASARIGGIIAGARDDYVSKLERYGMNLGMAYQIMDDLEEHLGVEQGKASKKSSATLPWIYSQSRSPEEVKCICLAAIKDHSIAAKEALEGVGGDEKARERLSLIVDKMVIR